GTVTAFEWTNPHAYIELDVADERGVIKHWSIELGSPSILMQGGWKFKDLKYGDKVTAIVSPLKNGQSGALLSSITMPDGRVLGNGPLPTGRRHECSPPRRHKAPARLATARSAQAAGLPCRGSRPR